MENKSYIWNFKNSENRQIENDIGTSVHEFNSFHSSGKDGQVLVCAGKRATVILNTWCKVHKQKQNCVKCFYVQIKLFTTKSVHEHSTPINTDKMKVNGLEDVSEEIFWYQDIKYKISVETFRLYQEKRIKRMVAYWE